MLKRTLMYLAGALVVTVLGLQASRLADANSRTTRLEAERDFARARSELALRLSEDLAAELIQMTPPPERDGIPVEVLRQRGESLGQQARILSQGDPQLLDPAANPGLLQLFEELL